MKTVSTKLDNNLHNRFIEICNEDGKCQSEYLRNLIETVCEDLDEGEETPQDLEIELTPEPSKVAQGTIVKIIQDDIEPKILQNVYVEYD